MGERCLQVAEQSRISQVKEYYFLDFLRMRSRVTSDSAGSIYKQITTISAVTIV